MINPGTEPIPDTNYDQAFNNIIALLEDSSLTGLVVKHVKALDHEGRYGFILTMGRRSCKVLMPGILLDKVRYQDGANPFDFPRLYVDGSSWLWTYAVNRVREALSEDEGK